MPRSGASIVQRVGGLAVRGGLILAIAAVAMEGFEALIDSRAEPRLEAQLDAARRAGNPAGVTVFSHKLDEARERWRVRGTVEDPWLGLAAVSLVVAGLGAAASRAKGLPSSSDGAG